MTQTTPSTSAQGPVRRVRHKKRGTTYEVLHGALMQSTHWHDTHYRVPADGRAVVVYRSESDRSVWVRPASEFEDGRFEDISASPSPAAPDVSPSGDAVALREKIASFIDENAEVRGDHPSDFAILVNADELAASIVELLPLVWPRASLASDATPAPTSGSEDGGDWRPVLTDMVDAMNRYGHEIGDGDIPSAHRSLMWRAEQLLAKPASEPAGGDVCNLAPPPETYGGSSDEPWTGKMPALSSSAGPAVEQYRWRFRDGSGDWSAWFDCSPPCDGDDIEIETRTLYAHPAPATVEMLREAARDLIASRSSTYKAKNGRVMGIEDDAGEMMWIVPFDEMAALEAARGEEGMRGSDVASARCPQEPSTEINEAGIKAVSEMIDRVKATALKAEGEMFEIVYWGWLRLTSAYVHGHPYVAKPEDGMTPISALHVVDYTFNHWGPQIPGTPKLDDEAVLNEAAADEAWHREEDRRMRREVGEEI